MPVLTDRVDIANARLRFANGCIVNLTASRISRDRVRKIRFFQPSAYVSIDYATQKVEVYRLVKGGGPIAVDRGRRDRRRRTRSRSSASSPTSSRRSSSKRAPLVTGEAGRRALALAQAIIDKMSAAAALRSHENTKARRPIRLSSWFRGFVASGLCIQT